MTAEQPTPAPDNEEALREHSKYLGIQDACAWSVMDGFGLRYVTPFALALGANNRQIGGTPRLEIKIQLFNFHFPSKRKRRGKP